MGDCCIICRTPVRGGHEGVLFGAFGRPLLRACHKHAHVIRSGASIFVSVGLKGAEQLVKRKAPKLLEAVREVIKTRKELYG